MSSTMTFALPPDMRLYVAERVAGGMYGSTSAYIRELIRKDQNDQARRRLRELVDEGLACGPAHAWTPAERLALRQRALGRRSR